MFENLKLTDKTKEQIYDDGLKAPISETGKLLERIPRAINAALSDIDIWIAKKEYNVESTKKTLAIKLEAIDPNKIVSPEPYVAVPAIQAISYCMNSEELHTLYANLLSKAMVSDTKEKVHPSFIEIIKQMSPNDAVVLKEFSKSETPVPTATLTIVMKANGLRIMGAPFEVKESLKLISNIKSDLLSEDQIIISIDNIKRLGLITLETTQLSGETTYDYVKQSEHYSQTYDYFTELNESEQTAESIRINKKCLALTPLGQLFIDICINGF